MQYFTATDYYFMIINEMMTFLSSFFSQGIVVALFVLVIGAIFGIEFGKLVTKMTKKMGVDKAFENTGIKELLKKSGIKFSVADLAGWIVKWFAILSFLMIAVDILNLPQASRFLSMILSYLPNLVGALVILTIGLIVAQMVYEALENLSKSVGIGIYHVTAIASKWIIVVLTFLVVLDQIGIQTTMLQIFAGGLSFMIALAGGIAFGLGGQYYAKELIEEIKEKFSKHE